MDLVWTWYGDDSALEKLMHAPPIPRFYFTKSSFYLLISYRTFICLFHWNTWFLGRVNLILPLY